MPFGIERVAAYGLGGADGAALADFDGELGGLAGCGFVWELFANECDDSFALNTAGESPPSNEARIRSR